MADNNDGATVQPVMGAAFDEVDNEADGGAAAAMSDDDDESVVMNELDAYDAPDWQDFKGTPNGTAFGTRTQLKKCVIGLGLGMVAAALEDMDYDTYRQQNEAGGGGKTDSRMVLSTNGYMLMAKWLPLDFVFVQVNPHKADYVYPSVVAWNGPEAKLDLLDSDGKVVHSQRLGKYKTNLKKHKIEGYDASVPFSTMRIRISQGDARCRVRFVYQPPTGAAAGGGKMVVMKRMPKHLVMKSMASDMDADESGKDVTIECADGQTIKVHKVLLCLYSPQFYGAKFKQERWDPIVAQKEDKKEAWELIVGSMYDVPIPTWSPHIDEAMHIAYRDMFPKFAAMAWTHGVKAIDKESVLSMLQTGWLYRQNGEGGGDAEQCVNKCLDFVFGNLTALGSAFVVEYGKRLEADDDMAAYADHYFGRLRVAASSADGKKKRAHPA